MLRILAAAFDQLQAAQEASEQRRQRPGAPRGAATHLGLDYVPALMRSIAIQARDLQHDNKLLSAELSSTKSVLRELTTCTATQRAALEESQSAVAALRQERVRRVQCLMCSFLAVAVGLPCFVCRMLQ
jgi:hypothetical protein